MTTKQGPLTVEELLGEWEASVDSSYARPLIAAGDGGGLELAGQAAAQLARFSQAVDTTTQAMYVLPWSGQTAEPAGGARKALVTLSIARGMRVQAPLVLQRGRVLFEEEQADWEDAGALLVLTGRRYALLDDVVFMPGEAGPFTVVAEAERPGYGYNNPLPNTIVRAHQPGAGFANDGASVRVVAGALGKRCELVTANEADTLVPDHVGQYVRLTAGANAGLCGRVTAFAPPDPVANVGSVGTVEVVYAVEGTYTGGAFVVGESVAAPGGVAGRVMAERRGLTATRVAVALDQMVAPAVGGVLTGAQSGATCTVTMVLYGQLPVAEAGTAVWRVLDWHLEHGVEVAHPESPQGGRAGMLDAHGEDRGLPRLPGEDDETYRQRISHVADVVSPNAIRRTMNRQVPDRVACLREVGSAKFPGFYLDVDALDTNVVGIPATLTDAAWLDNEPLEVRTPGGDVKARGYNCAGLTDGTTVYMVLRGAPNLPPVEPTDVIVAPRNGTLYSSPGTLFVPGGARDARYNCLLDYASFRGFFLVGVPRINYGEFGLTFDGHHLGFYDEAPRNAFDGYPALAPAFYGRIQDALDGAKAGGVGFDLVVDDDGSCA